MNHVILTMLCLFSVACSSNGTVLGQMVTETDSNTGSDADADTGVYFAGGIPIGSTSGRLI